LVQIEVWDADAHIPIGSAQVDLRQLLRQGREAVQTAGEYSVTDSSLSLPVDGGGGGGNLQHGFEGAAASVVANAVGSVFLRMVNVGCLSNGPVCMCVCLCLVLLCVCVRACVHMCIHIYRAPAIQRARKVLAHHLNPVYVLQGA